MVRSGATPRQQHALPFLGASSLALPAPALTVLHAVPPPPRRRRRPVHPAGLHHVGEADANALQEPRHQAALARARGCVVARGISAARAPAALCWPRTAACTYSGHSMCSAAASSEAGRRHTLDAACVCLRACASLRPCVPDLQHQQRRPADFGCLRTRTHAAVASFCSRGPCWPGCCCCCCLHANSSALFTWFIALLIPFFGVRNWHRPCLQCSHCACRVPASGCCAVCSKQLLCTSTPHRSGCCRLHAAGCHQVINDLLGAFCVTFETYIIPCVAFNIYYHSPERRARALFKPAKCVAAQRSAARARLPQPSTRAPVAAQRARACGSPACTRLQRPSLP